LFGWGADVHGESGQVSGGLFSDQMSGLDEVQKEDDGWVGSRNGQNVQEDVAGNFLFSVSTEKGKGN